MIYGWVPVPSVLLPHSRIVHELSTSQDSFQMQTLSSIVVFLSQADILNVVSGMDYIGSRFVFERKKFFAIK
jgi:hypothetical protein